MWFSTFYVYLVRSIFNFDDNALLVIFQLLRYVLSEITFEPDSYHAYSHINMAQSSTNQIERRFFDFMLAINRLNIEHFVDKNEIEMIEDDDNNNNTNVIPVASEQWT